jgi:hypothetical protein
MNSLRKRKPHRGNDVTDALATASSFIFMLFFIIWFGGFVFSVLNHSVK